MERSPVLVVGVDTSDESVAALDWALRLAEGLTLRVVVVHAVGLLEEGGYRQRPDLDAIVEAAQQRVPGATAGVDILDEDGPAADVIVRIAERHDAALIVVGSRGLGQAPRLLGSVSEGVLAHAGVPVLIVPRP